MAASRTAHLSSGIRAIAEASGKLGRSNGFQQISLETAASGGISIMSDPDADGCNWSGRVVALKKAAKSLMEKRGAKAEKRNQKKWAKS